MSITISDPVVPASLMFGLSATETQPGTASAVRPFGLRQAQPQTTASVDLSDLVYDPARQVSTGPGVIDAKRTHGSITTNGPTVYDHTTRNDANNDPYTD